MPALWDCYHELCYLLALRSGLHQEFEGENIDGQRDCEDESESVKISLAAC